MMVMSPRVNSFVMPSDPVMINNNGPSAKPAADVLGNKKVVLARPFKRFDANTHGAEQQRFDRVLTGWVIQLSARKTKTAQIGFVLFMPLKFELIDSLPEVS